MRLCKSLRGGLILLFKQSYLYLKVAYRVGFPFLKYVLSSSVGAKFFCLYSVFYSTSLTFFRLFWIKTIKMGLCKEDKQLGEDISLCCCGLGFKLFNPLLSFYFDVWFSEYHSLTVQSNYFLPKIELYERKCWCPIFAKLTSLSNAVRGFPAGQQVL